MEHMITLAIFALDETETKKFLKKKFSRNHLTWAQKSLMSNIVKYSAFF